MANRFSSPPFDGGLIQSPIDFADMASYAVGAVGQARLRYSDADAALQVSISGAAYADIATTASVTLQGAYNGGQTITETGTAVSMSSTTATNNNVLTIAKSSTGPGNTGDGIAITMGANMITTAAGLRVTNNNLARCIVVEETGTGDTRSLYIQSPSGASGTLAMDDGSSASVGGATVGKIRYNTTGAAFQVSCNGGAWADIATGSGATPTLQQVYDAGNTINKADNTAHIIFQVGGNAQGGISDNTKLFDGIGITTGDSYNTYGEIAARYMTLTDVASGNIKIYAAVTSNADSTIRMASTSRLIWTDGQATGTIDTGLSRVAANVTGVGNGTGGNASGTLRVTNVQAPAATALNLGGAAATRISLTAAGNVVTNATGANLAQNATDGFLYVPVCDTGAPSGTPTAITGATAMVAQGDTLYFRGASDWVALSGGGAGPFTSSGTNILTTDSSLATLILNDATTSAAVTRTIKAPDGTATAVGSALVLASGAGGGTSGASGAITIQSGSVTQGGGGAITIAVANSNDGGSGSGFTGNNLTLTAGNADGGSASGASGGSVLITAGSAAHTGGSIPTGGAVTLTAGAGTLQAGGTGAIGGSASLVGGAGAGTSAGGAAQVTGGAGGATGAGGAVTITSGAGGATSGASGAITIQPGTVTSGAGGAINITGRAGAASNNVGTTITLTGGDSAGSGTGGGITITGGASASGLGGLLIFTGGQAPTGGQVTISGGAGTSGAGGAAYLVGGNGGISAGSNTNGGSAVIQTGFARGTGYGRVVVDCATSGASGNTINGRDTRLLITGKRKALTSATDTTIALLSIATGEMIGCTVFYTVRATDATDFQATSGIFNAAGVNKAGTVTAGVSTTTPIGNATACSTGTLTVTVNAVASTTNLAIQINATSSLTETTLEVEYTIIANGPTTITEQ